MRHAEFPHDVAFLIKGKKIPDGGGGWLLGEWATYDESVGFLDTPKSEAIYRAQQANHPFDRQLYFPYRTDITTKMRVVCEGDTYELVGKPLDQGGQNEIMRVDLRLLADG